MVGQEKTTDQAGVEYQGLAMYVHISLYTAVKPLTYSRLASSTLAPAPTCVGVIVAKMATAFMAGEHRGAGIASATMRISSSSACPRPRKMTPSVGTMDMSATVSGFTTCRPQDTG